MDSRLMDVLSLIRVLSYGVLCIVMVVQGIFRLSTYRIQRLLLGSLFALLLLLTQTRPSSLTEEIFIPVWVLYTLISVALAVCALLISVREVRLRRPPREE